MQPLPVNLRQRAYDSIRDMMVKGRIPPGTRVSTLALAKELSISRTPIREAISRLAHQGLIKEMPGFGAYVPMPDREELVELYALREVLEVFGAAEAAKYIREDELAQLDDLCQQWLVIVKRLRVGPEQRLDEKLHNNWVRIDEQFHAVLHGAARNRMLSRTLGDMRLLSRTLDLRKFDSGERIMLGGSAWSYRHHAAVVRALRRHDADAAAYWMRQHIRAGRRGHLEYFDARQRRLKEAGGVASDGLD